MVEALGVFIEEVKFAPIFRWGTIRRDWIVSAVVMQPHFDCRFLTKKLVVIGFNLHSRLNASDLKVKNI